MPFLGVNLRGLVPIQNIKLEDLRELMVKNVRVIYPEDSVIKAVELMSKYGVDCLPVVDWKYNLIGIVTSIDVLLFIYNRMLDDLIK